MSVPAVGSQRVGSAARVDPGNSGSFADVAALQQPVCSPALS